MRGTRKRFSGSWSFALALQFLSSDKKLQGKPGTLKLTFSPLKMLVSNRNLLFPGGLFFRGEPLVSGRVHVWLSGTIQHVFKTRVLDVRNVENSASNSWLKRQLLQKCGSTFREIVFLQWCRDIMNLYDETAPHLLLCKYIKIDIYATSVVDICCFRRHHPEKLVMSGLSNLANILKWNILLPYIRCVHTCSYVYYPILDNHN